MAKPTAQERRHAKLHATVWEGVFHATQENSNRRTDIDQNIMRTLGTFALMIGGEYRKIANGNDIDD